MLNRLLAVFTSLDKVESIDATVAAEEVELAAVGSPFSVTIFGVDDALEPDDDDDEDEDEDEDEFAALDVTEPPPVR